MKPITAEDESMVLYHRTSTPTANLIVLEGFQDGLDERVWFSDSCYGTWALGGDGGAVLAVEFPHDDLGAYEQKVTGDPSRAWCIPASLVNRCCRIRLATEEEQSA